MQKNNDTLMLSIKIVNVVDACIRKCKHIIFSVNDEWHVI